MQRLIKILALSIMYAGLLISFVIFSPERSYGQSALQDYGDCIYKVRKLFEQGHLKEAKLSIEDCLAVTNNFSKLVLLKQLTLINLFLKEDENAIDAYLKLLKLNPRFEPNPFLEHPELVKFSTRFKSQPKSAFGFFVGYNFSKIKITKVYSLNGRDKINETFSNASSPSTGFFYIRDFGNFFFSVSPLFSVNSLKYKYNTSFLTALDPSGMESSGDLRFTEHQKWLNIPFTLNANIFKLKARNGTSKQLSFYAKLGGQFDYLTEDIFTELYLILKESDLVVFSTGVDATQGSNKRSSLYLTNWSIVGGLGAKLFYNQNFFFNLDFSLSHTLRNMIRVKNRFDSHILSSTYNYVDSDRKLRNLYIHLGVGYQFYKAKYLGAN